MNAKTLPVFFLLAASSLAQVVVFPSDYAAVPEGPLNSPNLPLARGTSRVMCLYEASDVNVPPGDQITALGFRQDGVGSTDPGRQLQIEVRMGYTSNSLATFSNSFDGNYATTPVTVFGPSVFVLPNLRDPAAALPNGRFFLQLTTPFVYQPASGENLLVEYRIFGTSGGGGQFTYRLDRADHHSPVSYGPTGCTHSTGGTAKLTVQPTRPGLGYVCQMADGPANSVGVLAVSIGQPLAPPYALTGVFSGIAPACQGQLSPIALGTIGGTTNAGGNESWFFQIPNNNAFAKIPISSQALFLDFFSPGGLVVSDGAEVTTGLRPRTAILAASGAPTNVVTGTISLHYAPVAFFAHQ